jgi:ribokinase
VRRLLTVGDLVLDVRVRPDRRLVHGSDVTGEVSWHPGGSAANVAVWAVRAGLAARFVGCVGDDAAAAWLRRDLEASGVEARLLARPGWRTGAVALWIHPDGERTMVTDRGANLALTAADVDPAWFAGVTWLHLTGYSLLTPGLRGAFAALTRQGVPFSFDPSSAALLAEALRPEEVLAAVAGAEVVFPNADEARFLTGAGPEAAVRRLAEHFPCAVVTCGADGCLVAAGGRVGHIPAPAVPVGDAAGAGDAFAAGFLAARLSGADPFASAAAGCALAGQALLRPGAR